MAFKHHFKLIFRVLLLASLIILLTISLQQDRWFVTSFVLAFFIILSVLEMIWFMERWRRELNRFLLLLRHRDYSGFAPGGEAPDDYRSTLASIADEFRAVRLEKERHYQFLQALTQHLRTAIICFHPDGKVVLANQAIHDLLGMALISEIKQIKRVSEALYDIIQAPEQNNPIIKLVIRDKLYRLSARGTSISYDQEIVSIVSLREIGSELDENESESWRKLIQVLTHEIMNSTTPVSSLSEAIQQMLENYIPDADGSVTLPATDFTDLSDSINSIRFRSKGLQQFAETYKNLSRLPKPNFEPYQLTNLMRYLKNLLDSEFTSRNINLTFQVAPANLTLLADQEMIQRVMINLLLNSMYATETIHDARVQITASQSESGSIRIRVKDNGHGIEPAHFEQIFTPFFTTRKGGSGLGLSISREIMRLHRGTIHIHSTVGAGTEVILMF